MKLSITTDATQVLLNPQRRSTDTVPLLVQVHLELGPRERPPSALHSLEVVLHRLECLEMDSKVEQNSFPELRASIDVAAQPPPRSGSIHTWQTIIKIPNTSPVYYPISPDSGTGSTTYLEASLRYPSRFRTPRVQTARKDIFLIHQAALAGVDTDPFVYTHTQAGAHDGLGPVLIQAHAQHLTVGGSLRVHVSLPAPSEHLNLRSIEFGIQQKTQVRSRQKPGMVHNLPVKRLKMLSERLSEPRADGWLLRLPSCVYMRPTSVCDKLGVHVTHLFTTRFCYSVFDPDAHTQGQSAPTTRAYTLAWNINIPSCALCVESVLLPTYSPSDPSPVPEADRSEIAAAASGTKATKLLCVCGKKRTELLAIDYLMAQVHSVPPGSPAFGQPEASLPDKLHSQPSSWGASGSAKRQGLPEEEHEEQLNADEAIDDNAGPSRSVAASRPASVVSDDSLTSSSSALDSIASSSGPSSLSSSMHTAISSISSASSAEQGPTTGSKRSGFARLPLLPSSALPLPEQFTHPETAELPAYVQIH